MDFNLENLELELDLDLDGGLTAFIMNVGSTIPYCVVPVGKAGVDEIRFGIAEMSILDRELEIAPAVFRWCDFKKWESRRDSQGIPRESLWLGRGTPVPPKTAWKIWKRITRFQICGEPGPPLSKPELL